MARAVLKLDSNNHVGIRCPTDILPAQIAPDYDKDNAARTQRRVYPQRLNVVFLLDEQRRTGLGGVD